MNGDWNERIFKRKKQKKETVEEIDLIPLFKAVVSKWWLIVIFAVVLGMVSYFVTDTFVTPTYRSGFTAYVNNRSGVTASGTEATGSKKLTTSDITASQSLVKTYSKIILSRSVLTEAASKANLNYTPSQLSKMVSTNTEDETEVIGVYVTAEDPKVAAQLASAIADVAPQMISRIIEGSSMQIIDEPLVPTSIYSPNYSKNTAVGFLIGAVIAVAIIVIKELLDDHVKNEEDLEDKFAIPVVGVIPDVNSAVKQSSKYAYAYKMNEGGKK